MYIVFIRVLIIYALIILSLRLMGKRQIGQLQPSELVVTILVSNIATMAIEDSNVPLIGGIIPILTLVSFDVLISAMTLRYKKMRRIVSGTPRVIIRDGKIDQKQLKELRFTIDDMMEALRGKDIFDVRDVAFAIVETTGSLSVYPKFTAQPATAGMLNLQAPPGADAPPVVLIADGVVIDSALGYCNLKYEWLEKTITDNGYTTQDIFLMTCNRQADYLIVPKAQLKLKDRKEDAS
ncbi:DUF421 domain-containing protein [Anaerotruncus massiliensis (ex Togo et al. 2019)]|uniref:DUF421 domain-containing protein n=1 Tax=Anaerotruncus massiliensis (ex Togo et al. 2019) TaxID=1673720 RepID=UPI0023F3B94B|nr:DUF421 domain-containing protein [Anaerotruncus massiliensis (ex Togo et al. 2019)]